MKMYDIICTLTTYPKGILPMITDLEHGLNKQGFDVVSFLCDTDGADYLTHESDHDTGEWEFWFADKTRTSSFKIKTNNDADAMAPVFYKDGAMHVIVLIPYSFLSPISHISKGVPSNGRHT